MLHSVGVLSPKPCGRHDVALIGFDHLDDVLVAINVNNSTVGRCGELVAVGWVVLLARLKSLGET